MIHSCRIYLKVLEQWFFHLKDIFFKPKAFESTRLLIFILALKLRWKSQNNLFFCLGMVFLTFIKNAQWKLIVAITNFRNNFNNGSSNSIIFTHFRKNTLNRRLSELRLNIDQTIVLHIDASERWTWHFV